VDDCYTALGVIHALWKPLPGEFKDYISFPKPNGYQSLHTTVLTPEAGIVEMQVRTEDMHQRAQHGIASHMSYKQLPKDKIASLRKQEQKKEFEKLSFSWRSLIPTLLHLRKRDTAETPVESVPKRLTKKEAPSWLVELADAYSPVAGSADFVEGLRQDFFSHRLFVFTPGGDVIDLPTYSTVIDFAYAIHSELGNHMNGAKVNGKLVSFDTRLRNGDVVEIIDRPTAKPTRKWLDYARTTLAKRHIRQALDESERGTTSARGELKPVKIRKKRAPKDEKKPKKAKQ
jgi:GTP pyrophosphokinase